jgi:hypothetical protein
MYNDKRKIILEVDGSDTPRPAAKGTGIIQYRVKKRTHRILDPKEHLAWKRGSGKVRSLRTQNMP